MSYNIKKKQDNRLEACLWPP